MPQTPSQSSDHPGPERRVAFFPRRLRNVRSEALLVDGERRSGEDRRKDRARTDPATAR